MTTLNPFLVAGVRPYVPLLRRLKDAGWNHLTIAINDSPWEHSWRRGPTGQRDLLILDNGDGLIIRPYFGPEWDVPVISPEQVATVLELAGVLPPVRPVGPDAVASFVIQVLRTMGWRPAPHSVHRLRMIPFADEWERDDTPGAEAGETTEDAGGASC